MVFRYLFIIFLSLFTLTVNSQNQSKVEHIDSLKVHLTENENDQSLYENIFTDGLISRKILGIFKTTKYSGAYSEQYIIDDSLLVKLWIATTIYQDRNKTVSKVKIENFIFENENLCYYEEQNLQIQKNKSDSLLFKIEYYLDNENILKFDSKGNFENESTEYLTQILKTARKKIKYKNALIDW